MSKTSKTKKGLGPGEEKVFPDDLMNVDGTGKSKFLLKGKTYTVHKILGERFIRSGKATLSKVQPEPVDPRRKGVILPR